jgi:hypothetical protein
MQSCFTDLTHFSNSSRLWVFEDILCVEVKTLTGVPINQLLAIAEEWLCVNIAFLTETGKILGFSDVSTLKEIRATLARMDDNQELSGDEPLETL